MKNHFKVPFYAILSVLMFSLATACDDTPKTPEEIDAYYLEVLAIPASNLEANRRGYRELMRLAPNNIRYAERYAHYTKLIEDREANSRPSREAPSTRGAPLKVDQAVPYEIIESRDTSFLSRRRYAVFVYAPDALTIKQRAQTALRAAIDISNEMNAHAVGTFLVAMKEHGILGYVILASADYAADGKGWTGESAFKHGTWEARVSDANLSESDLKLVAFWGANASRFETLDDGFGGKMLDEDKLNKFVARKFDISLNEVKQSLIRTMIQLDDYIP